MVVGERRLTNEAHMWYVPVNTENVNQVLPVPQLSISEEQSREGQILYNQQRQQRVCTVLHMSQSSMGGIIILFTTQSCQVELWQN